MTTSLADLLGKYLQQTHTSVNRLAKLSGVPQRTIANWLNGDIRKPRHWQDLVQTAVILHLSEAETNALLKSAGHPSLSQLRAKAATDADRALLANLQPPVSQSPLSPFQAIADLFTFVGRHAELDEVKRALLSSGRAAICGLRGMGGVGKTTLAAHLAYQLRGDFPDGVLWARLDTSDTLSILAAFADAYGKDVSQYKDVDSRAMVVRTLLADKRVLIILDNAQTSAEVRPLLPPSTGKPAILITSRHDLEATDGWARLAVEPFAAQSGETLALFAKFLGAKRVQGNSEALLEIGQLLGHLPLALAITAGKLAADSGATAVSYAALLRQNDARLGELTREDRSVRLTFDVSYETLPQDLQPFFASLGVFDGEDFGTDAAAYITETMPEIAEARLNYLMALSLLQESRAGCWRLHPLLRDYAREKLSECGWLISVVARTLQTFQQVAHGQWQFARSVDAEMLNVRFAFDQAAELGLYPLFLETIQALYPIWASNSWHRMAIDYLDQARVVAQLVGDTLMEIRMTTWYASAQNALGNVQVGQQTLQTALNMAQSNGKVRELADILCVLGKLYNDLGDFSHAAPYYEQSLVLARQVDDPVITARNLNNIGLIEHAQGHYSRAERLFTEALTLFRALDLALAVNVVLMNLANVHNALGDLERAMALYWEALELARQSNHRNQIVGLLLNLALAYTYYYRDYAQAEPLLMEALKIAIEIGAQRLESQVRLGYANILRLRCQFSQAERQIQECLALADRMADGETRMKAFCLQGELFLDMQRSSEAETSLEMALSIAGNLVYQDTAIAEILFIQARTSFAQAQPAQACRLAQESLQLYEKMGPPARVETVRRWLENLPQTR